MPRLNDQVERCIELGLHELAGTSAASLRAVTASSADGVLVVPGLAASALTPLLERKGKPGFVVVDMPDVDDFGAIAEVSLPSAPYLLTDLSRGDHLANWSPNEALPAILAAGRSPLTLGEGIQWLLQQPEVLERNHCFMTIGSRKCLATGELDTRTPAIWISNGTGRDGRDNREAPKVGWCWAGNRHTWLGFASAAGRLPVG